MKVSRTINQNFSSCSFHDIARKQLIKWNISIISNVMYYMYCCNIEQIDRQISRTPLCQDLTIALIMPTLKNSVLLSIHLKSILEFSQQIMSCRNSRGIRGEYLLKVNIKILEQESQMVFKYLHCWLKQLFLKFIFSVNLQQLQD